MKLQRIDGKPIRDGQTVSSDHVVQKFTVTVRSLNMVGTDTIRDLIQKKFEVMDIECTGGTVYVNPGMPDFIGDE